MSLDCVFPSKKLNKVNGFWVIRFFNRLGSRRRELGQTTVQTRTKTRTTARGLMEMGVERSGLGFDGFWDSLPIGLVTLACLRFANLAGKFKVRQESNSAIRRFLHAHFTPADDEQADCAKSSQRKCRRFRHRRRREKSGVIARIAEIITHEFPAAV